MAVGENKVLRFYVTPHARARYEERVGKTRRDVAPEIVKLIRTSIDAERRSKRRPRWIGYSDYRPRNTAPNKMRYVWDEDKQICFLLVERYFKGTPAWYVVTTMTRLENK